MSVDYAAGLSLCDDLGVCGLDEIYDKPEIVKDKVRTLANWLRLYKGSCVVHVGAGLSTAAGIPDFRGKNGVWTRLRDAQQGASRSTTSAAGSTIKEEESRDLAAETEPASSSVKPFDETVPTPSHFALKTLCKLGLVKHIVSQNVDGLFLKSNIERKFVSELHGNFFLDECTKCRSRFIRASASTTMRLQRSTVKCPRGEQLCRGHLRDTILDWESPIPYNELRVATRESKRSRLHICIGTTLQLRPSKDLVCSRTEKSKKLVIINLQPTKFDQRANLVINYYADYVMTELARQLEFEIPAYDSSQDPTKDSNFIGALWKK